MSILNQSFRNKFKTFNNLKSSIIKQLKTAIKDNNETIFSLTLNRYGFDSTFEMKMYERGFNFFLNGEEEGGREFRPLTKESSNEDYHDVFILVLNMLISSEFIIDRNSLKYLNLKTLDVLMLFKETENKFKTISRCEGEVRGIKYSFIGDIVEFNNTHEDLKIKYYLNPPSYESIVELFYIVFLDLFGTFIAPELSDECLTVDFYNIISQILINKSFRPQRNEINLAQFAMFG